MPLTQKIKPTGIRLMFAARRVFNVFIASTGLACFWLLTWESPVEILFGRMWSTGLLALIAFGVFEQWPKRLPQTLPRWVLQIVAVALVIPLSMFGHYCWSAQEGIPFWNDLTRLQGFLALTMSGLLVAPWLAVTALIRQKEAFAHDQALAFELERSELARQATDARLQLLQAQVAPHFLFNTLANVQALVQAGSPKAHALLGSLTAYLRASVPRLQQSSTTLAEEQQLVCAYLELMHMRMPDRLRFHLQLDPRTLTCVCPPMTLMTLVENAVKHGIDPSEEGGEIFLDSFLTATQQCVLRVRNTGAPLLAQTQGLGTGLSSLRERLQLSFGGNATLSLRQGESGVTAEISFPAGAA
jgi:hypothetical protein